MVAHVGALARSVVRSNDVVGHLGAGRFALLLPRAGTFEARSAYRRVREAVAASEFATDGLGCGQAGFAELGDGSGDEMLAVATKRLTEAVRRTAYTGPGDPMHPLAG
jgi:GGDEF domain-containing protein